MATANFLKLIDQQKISESVKSAYDVICNNLQTPYLVVNFGKIKAPTLIPVDGLVIFDISKDAVIKLSITHDLISFKTKFSGKSATIEIPITEIFGIYSKESEMGVFLGSDFSKLTKFSKSVKPRQSNDNKFSNR